MSGKILTQVTLLVLLLLEVLYVFSLKMKGQGLMKKELN